VNRIVLLVGALLVVPLLVFLAIGFRFDPRAIDSPLVGKPAPPFSLTDLDGTVISLEALRGTPVVINFWATWCQPCIAEHPVLQAEARRWEGKVRFLGIIYQDQPEPIRRFLARRGSWGPSLVDPGSRVAIAYGVYGAPETFVIGPDGTIVEKITGMVDPRRLDRLLDPLL